MKLRKLIRWVFSGLSALFAMMLAPNIEKLMAARGWDTFLLGMPDTQASGLGSLISRPLVDLSAALIIGITVGLWIDPAIAVLDGRRASRPGKWQRLGRDAIDLAYNVRERRTSYFRQDATDIFAEINTMRVRLWKHFLQFPTMKSEMTTNHRLWIVERHLLNVGGLLSEGFIDEARATAAVLARDLPNEPYEDKNERI